MSRHLPITAAALLLAASAAFSQGGIAPVIQTLEAQGFTVVETTREANRVRIEARSASQQRELVYDSRTGELLSDELTPLRATARATGTEFGRQAAPRGLAAPAQPSTIT